MHLLNEYNEPWSKGKILRKIFVLPKKILTEQLISDKRAGDENNSGGTVLCKPLLQKSGIIYDNLGRRACVLVSRWNNFITTQEWAVALPIMPHLWPPSLDIILAPLLWEGGGGDEHDKEESSFFFRLWSETHESGRVC